MTRQLVWIVVASVASSVATGCKSRSSGAPGDAAAAASAAPAANAPKKLVSGTFEPLAVTADHVLYFDAAHGAVSAVALTGGDPVTVLKSPSKPVCHASNTTAFCWTEGDDFGKLHAWTPGRGLVEVAPRSRVSSMVAAAADGSRIAYQAETPAPNLFIADGDGHNAKALVIAKERSCIGETRFVGATLVSIHCGGGDAFPHTAEWWDASGTSRGKLEGSRLQVDADGVHGFVEGGASGLASTWAVVTLDGSTPPFKGPERVNGGFSKHAGASVALLDASENLIVRDTKAGAAVTQLVPKFGILAAHSADGAHAAGTDINNMLRIAATDAPSKPTPIPDGKSPRFTADGRYVAFLSRVDANGSMLSVVEASGTAAPVKLEDHASVVSFGATPARGNVVYTVITNAVVGPGRTYDLMNVDTRKGTTPVALAHGVHNTSLTTNGEAIVYTIHGTPGAEGIYVVPLP